MSNSVSAVAGFVVDSPTSSTCADTSYSAPGDMGVEGEKTMVSSTAPVMALPPVTVTVPAIGLPGLPSRKFLTVSRDLFPSRPALVLYVILIGWLLSHVMIEPPGDGTLLLYDGYDGWNSNVVLALP